MEEAAAEVARARDAKERSAAVERLRQKLLEPARKGMSSSELASVVGACVDLLKDNNNNNNNNPRVSQGVLQTLASAAALSGEHFKPHINAVVSAAVDRLGDARQSVRDSARRLLLALMEVCSPASIVERAGSHAWKHRNWRVREEFSRTAASAICLFPSAELPLNRAVLHPILQMLSDPNPALRKAAMSCIEEMYSQAGIIFREELNSYHLPSNMIKEINAKLERIKPEVPSSVRFSGREIKHLISEEEGGFHRQYASPVCNRGSQMGFSHPSAPGYGTSAIVARDRSPCSSGTTLPFGLLLSPAKSPALGTEHVLETVSHSSKESASAIENMLRGLDLSEKQNSTIRSSFQSLGVEKTNGFQSRKTLNGEKHIPGCLGRMVNLFDMSPAVAGNRMLMDRPHRDGSSLARSQSDIARMSSPFGIKIEDKMIVSELQKTSSNKKANGTPMKMLLDVEMSKEFESRNEPPNVVAKLMGLDELPRLQPHSLQRSNTNGYTRSPFSHSGTSLGSWEQGLAESRTQLNGHQCSERNNFKDVYEVWQQPQNTNYVRDSLLKERHRNAHANDRKMDLVRQKFMEVQRLGTDEKLRQSKEFHDALEVLNSNKDILFKFLQESNQLLSEHLNELQHIPSPPETKRITVLRPTKTVDTENFSASKLKSEKQIKKPAQVNPERSPLFYSSKIDEHPLPPTRIVVLKPSTGKTHDIRAVSSPISSPRVLHVENICGDLEYDEARESKEVAKQITRHMRENLMGHHRDETLFSSVFSNGYTGDESSFNKSENEFAAENLSDSEVLSPLSRHSWDYINRLGSPFSSSCFSRASCSPESSVCREAKKRLSERWAMVASNGLSQEQRHVRRSSSTLGEMLALSDVKKSTRADHDDIKEETELRGPSICLTSNSVKEDVCDSPRSLLRSKSVPVISTVYDVSDSAANNADVPKELIKAKSSKSSLKGKVSSLFFSRSKKSTKEKSGQSRSSSESQSASEAPGSSVPGETGHEKCLPPLQCGSSGSREAGLSLSKPLMPGIASENQDQPSPISVLEPLFEDEENTTRDPSGHVKPNPLGGQLMRSNLLDKSPPIGSIARTLSWGESRTDTSSRFPTKPSSSLPREEEEEEFWLGFVQTLLYTAGLDENTRLESFTPVFPKWHSPESPLDPSLREKLVGEKDSATTLHESRQRQRRSVGKLVFDRVNADLAEITTTTTTTYTMEGYDSPVVVDFLWARMKSWFSGEIGRCLLDDDGGDGNSLAVDGVVRREVVGRGWVDLMGLEVHYLGKEIEGKLLQELVEEAVVDLTAKI